MITFWSRSCVWGSILIIPGKEYALLETVVMALELVSASKRLLGSDTPQGNTQLPGTWAIPTKLFDRTWARLSCIQNEMDLL